MRLSAQPVYVSMSAETVLSALSPSASPALREAIAAGCCIVYTVSEGDCSPGCGSGWCCYHAVSADCGLDVHECVNVPCTRGGFKSGC